MAKVGGIQEYQRVRKYLRNIYVYGFFSREDFERAGIGSAKDYDAGISLIRAVFPELDEDAVRKEKRKYLRFRRSYMASGMNRLAESYRLHTISETGKLPELLWILSALSGKRATMEKLIDEVECHRETEGGKGSTTRRRVGDLVEYGAVEKRGTAYCMRQDGLEKLSDHGLRQLWDYVRFAGGITFPRVAGAYLCRTIERELARRGKAPGDTVPFLLRHNVNSAIFDEDLVYGLLTAIRQRCRVTLQVQGRQEPVEHLPVELRVDIRLGRWYLVGVEQSPLIRRVSRIIDCQPGSAVPEEEWNTAAEQAREAFANTGCSGAADYGHPVRVEAKLCFDGMPGLRNQFARELRLGRIESREDGEYYCALLNDPREVLPMLRAYAPWLKVQPGEHDLDRRLEDSLRRMQQSLKGGEPT